MAKHICDYMDGDISKDCCEKLEEHIKKCDKCRIEYSEIKRIADLCRKSRVTLQKNEKKMILKNIIDRINNEKE